MDFPDHYCRLKQMMLGSVHKVGHERCERFYTYSISETRARLYYEIQQGFLKSLQFKAAKGCVSVEINTYYC